MKDIHQVYKFLKPSLEDLTPVQRRELAKLISSDAPEETLKRKKTDPIPSVAEYKRRLLRTGLFKSRPGKA